MNVPSLDQLCTPHPDQIRIDAECARLLLKSSRLPGGQSGWRRPAPTVGITQINAGDPDRPARPNRR
jgi:hypothetical protein